MAYAGILVTVELYQQEKDQLTSQESGILMDITDATRQSSKVSAEEVTAESDLKEQYTSTSSTGTTSTTDSTEYEVALEELQDKFTAKLSEINTWEKELEVQKSNLDTEIQSVTSYLESYQSVLKTNVKNDSSYGEVTSGSSS